MKAYEFGELIRSTKGGGGNNPSNPAHKCVEYSLKESGRILFRRGLPEDDLANKNWARWFQSLTKNRAKNYKYFGNTISVESQGNALEMITVFSYVASQNCQNMPASLQVRSDAVAS